MCDHEELLDSGEFVCIKCGIVLGQEYIHQENTFQHKDIKSKDESHSKRLKDVSPKINDYSQSHIHAVWIIRYTL